MSGYGYPKYVSVGEKKEKAAKTIKGLQKRGIDVYPIVIEGRTIAKQWWGKTWNANLESYADYYNRIDRGRAYVRNGAVIDLKITKGTIEALVQGSAKKPYEVIIEIDTLTQEKRNQVAELCNRRIDSLEQLLEGKFPKELEVLFAEKKYGLFPRPDEIHFNCTCPDWAHMCKHVAAVLYGVGARLDQKPMLFFQLRDVDSAVLIKQSMESKVNQMLENVGNKSHRQIDDGQVLDIFGISMEEELK